MSVNFTVRNSTSRRTIGIHFDPTQTLLSLFGRNHNVVSFVRNYIFARKKVTVNRYLFRFSVTLSK